MPIRDLRYPEDAAKVIDSLVGALAYDASIAILGVRSLTLPPPEAGPIGDVHVRASGKNEDEAVQREAPFLLSRMALTQMLGHFEEHMTSLLLQRRVLEHLAPGRRMGPGEMWGILKKVDAESRQGPVAVTFGKVVEAPSERLAGMRPWLTGLYAVRNCLTHRNGRVALFDVAPDRKRLEKTKDSDRLQATWPTLRVRVNGELRDLPFTHPGGDLAFSFETLEHSWGVGDLIHVSPEDAQGACFALTFLANEVLHGFQLEMNRILRPHDH